MFSPQTGSPEAVTRGPVRTSDGGKVLEGHPVTAGRPLVGFHALPCPAHIRGVYNPPHQVIVQGWLREQLG
ncbi:MAG: hypothetical protein ACREXR_05820 [Gammaproteobacteria bacterium]